MPTWAVIAFPDGSQRNTTVPTGAAVNGTLIAGPAEAAGEDEEVEQPAAAASSPAAAQAAKHIVEGRLECRRRRAILLSHS
jgi:hypothetical protein